MPEKVTSFRGEFAFLSNFHPVPHGVYGYPTNEHFFVAMKSLDRSYRDMIKATPQPGEVKRLGRTVELRSDWEWIVDKVMLTGLKVKFKPGSHLAGKLVCTMDAILIEGNWWHDNYWGDCSCKKCAGIEGQNKLGRMLMTVRNELLVLPDA